MADLKNLRERMGNILGEARAKLSEIKDDTPEERAAEIEREYDAMMADYDKLEARAERASKLDDAQRRAEAFAEDVHTGRRPQPSGEGRGVDDAEPMDYRTAFHGYLRARGNVGAMSPEARAVLEQGYRAMPAEQRAQLSGTDSAGGYTVPTELMNQIEVSLKAHGPMYDGSVITEVVTNGGGQLTMPTVDDTTVTAGAHTEGATMTDDGGKDVTFGEKTLDAFAFDTEWLRVSRELADDSIFAMEALIGDLLGERLARLANSQLTTGTGSSAPNGIVTASALGQTAAGTAAITFDEVIDLEHSVDPAYRGAPKVAYMFNDSTLKALRQLKDGDGNYLWQMGNVQAGIPNTFNGRTYHINQDMPSLATGQKVMLFGDFGKYYVRKVGAPLIGAIEDKDFWPGFGIAGYIRFDGELSNTAAVKHLITA